MGEGCPPPPVFHYSKDVLMGTACYPSVVHCISRHFAHGVTVSTSSLLAE